MNTKQITKKVTEGIINCLEKGVVPWNSGIINTIGSATKFDGDLYHGVNQWILNAEVLLNDYKVNRWVTFNRCRKEGGRVIKGQKSTEVVFWKMFETEQTNKDGKVVEKTIPLLRTFRLFNICQTTLYKPSKTKKVNKVNKVNNEIAEQLIGNWNNEVAIKYGFDNTSCPYYSPSKDFINIPFGNGIKWESAELLNKVTFHEMIHSTGNSKRLNRFGKAELNGTKADILHNKGDYSAEELVAEFGSQILADYCDFKDNHIENTSSYINSWIKCLKNNTDWILWASRRAEKAVELIINKK